MKEFLEKLKSGDKVVVSSRDKSYKQTVDRVTKTQIIVGGERFNKSNGHRRGDDTWTFVVLEEWTAEKEKAIKYNAWVADVVSVFHYKCTKDHIRNMTSTEIEAVKIVVAAIERESNA
jgi:hypothetical protein